MLLWSFLATVFTPPAEVPEEYELTDDEAERWTRLTSQEKNIYLKSLINKKNLLIRTIQEGFVRYCNACQQIKPDRAHHCSVCNTCVLKMDHHCPWVNNCIGYSNFKCFYLTTFYCVVYCVYFASTIYKHIYSGAGSKEHFIPVVVGLILSLVFGMIGLIFCLFNSDLLLRNQTVLERMRQPRFVEGNVTYNLGLKRNFLEVFGRNCLLWPLPIFTGLGTGYTFEVRRLE